MANSQCRPAEIKLLPYREAAQLSEFLAKIIDAHGGMDRWKAYEKVEASIVTGGGFFALKGLAQDSDPRRMTVWLHEERSSVLPYGALDQRTMFTPDRIAVEKLDGTVVAERRVPKESFAGHQMNTPWDSLHRAYFNGEALWTYLVTPFLLAMEGVAVEEVEPWREGAETWRGLRAYFPGSIETHSQIQDFFFGEDLLLRRHDYNVNIAGGFGAAAIDLGLCIRERDPPADQAPCLLARSWPASRPGHADGLHRHQRRKLQPALHRIRAEAPPKQTVVQHGGGSPPGAARARSISRPFSGGPTQRIVSHE